MPIKMNTGNNFYVNNEYVVNLLEKNKISLYLKGLLFELMHYIDFDDNRIILNKHSKSFVDFVCEIAECKTTKAHELIREAESLNIIKRVKEYGIMNAYFNPNICFGNSISIPTYRLFDEINEEKVKVENEFSEKDLELYLMNNLNLIEEGLVFIDNQYTIDGGYIDILCRDKNGILCIIELKITNNDTSIVFQSVYYPTQFDEPTRMITVAPDYSNKIEASLRSLGYVEMKTYSFVDDELIISDYN